MAYSERPPKGQATMANSEPVVIASDQSAVPVSASNLDIRDLTFAADKVDASGTVLGAGTNNIGDVDILSIAAGDNNIGNVDIVTLPALTAGDNVIGRVKLTDGTDVADILDLTNSNPLVVAMVDGNGDQITSFGGGTQYTEDAAAAANPVGNALIVIRDDTRSGSLTTTDGDNVALRGTNNGELYVKHSDMLEVYTSVENYLNVTGTVALVDGNGSTLADVLDLTNSNPLTVAIVDSNGDQITSFGGGTQYTEDAAAAADTVGGVTMLVRKDTPATITNTDGDNVAQRGTNYGAAYVQIVSSTGSYVDSFGGGTQYTQGDTDASITGTAMLMEGAADTLLPVQGTVADGLLVNLGANNDVTVTGNVTVINSGTFAVQDSNIASVYATDGAADTGRLLQVGGHDGTNAQTLSTNASGHLNIADGGNTITVDGTVAFSNTTIAVTNTGTFATQAASAGDIAHDSPDSTSNPQKMGARAIAHGTNPTAVAADDRTNLYANRHGILWSIGGHPNLQSAEYFTSGAITDDNILPAISAGTKYVITCITVTCSAANATTPSVRIGFGTASVPAQGATNADGVAKVVLSHPGIPAGSGIVKGNGAGIVGIGGDGEELRITCTTPTTSMIVQVDYYTIES
jgi:hypothetical protein